MSISDWADLMATTVSYAAVATRDAYGKPATYSTAVTYTARVSWKYQRVVSRETGQDTLSNCQIWIAGVLSSMKPDDKFTLDDGSTPKVVSWDIPTDENGEHHTKVYCRG